MDKNFRYVMARILVVVMGVLTIVFASSCLKSNSSQVSFTDNKGILMTSYKSDPCLFLNYTAENANDPGLLDRQKRETFGYSAETSLAEAVKTFNGEQKCYPDLADPLTENEVVAAIAAGSDYGYEEISRYRPDLLRIVTQKKMPKGSLLVAEGDASYNNRFLEGEVFIKGQRIYVFLGLDKNPRESEPLKSGQTFLIRKKFIKTGL